MRSSEFTATSATTQDRLPQLEDTCDDEVGRGAIDAWEGEGGSADSRPRDENGRVNELERVPIADRLSWEMSSETFYPGKKRHYYFPAISAWSRYRDGDCSWPQGTRQREAPALIARGRSS
jgi:hypothetical protein